MVDAVEEPEGCGDPDMDRVFEGMGSARTELPSESTFSAWKVVHASASTAPFD